jgi:dTDP-4-amino-4,6-dideoxygalactose transaminase
MTIPFLDLNSMHADLHIELDAAWREVSRSGKFIGGEFVERFEADWAEYCGTKHCVGLSSGTTALQLGLTALGIGAGDEVIVPANTFVATAEAVAAVGATPVYIDVDPSTLLMTAAGVAAAVTARTAGVIAVHLYGQPVNMDAIQRVAAAAGIAVVEDAAQAHGATWAGRRVGSLSDVGCFSFYPGKNLGAFGDAGAVVTGDSALAERIRKASDHGRPRGAPHLHEIRGGTHRLDAIQAAILLVKLKRLDSWNTGRRRAAACYDAALAGLPLERVKCPAGGCSNHHLAVVQTPHRNAVRQKLTMEDIATGIHYPVPCHRQPAFASSDAPRLPVVEHAANHILSLPMSPHLSEAAVRRVVDSIARALAELEQSRGSPAEGGG